MTHEPVARQLSQNALTIERFGRYVLGTEGWRAQWVVIRELMAPDSKTALALMGRYPEVKVHVRAGGNP